MTTQTKRYYEALDESLNHSNYMFNNVCPVREQVDMQEFQDVLNSLDLGAHNNE